MNSKQSIVGLCLGLLLGLPGSDTDAQTVAVTPQPAATRVAAPYADVPELNAGQTEEVVRWGFAQLGERNLDEAAHAFERVLLADRMNRSARFGLSTVFVEKGYARQAVGLWEKMLVDFPEDHAVLNNYAWLLATTMEADIRDPARALDLARNAMVLAPEDHHVWSTLAEAYFAGGEFEPAKRAALKAYELYRARFPQGDRLNVYVQQVERCTQAMRAFDILD